MNNVHNPLLAVVSNSGTISNYCEKLERSSHIEPYRARRPRGLTRDRSSRGEYRVSRLLTSDGEDNSQEN